MLKQFEESLAVLSTARYGRNATVPSSELDTAFENGVDALKKLRVARMWPMRMVGSTPRLSAEVGWTT